MRLQFVTYLVFLNTFFYMLSFLMYHFKKNKKILLYIAVSLNLATLIVRSLIAKHPPITNGYETVLLFSFLISLRLIFWTKQISKSVANWIILVIVALNVLSLLLPEAMKEPGPLMPALNSFWMYIHVPSYMVGYATLAIAFVYALIIFLGEEKIETSKLQSFITKMDGEVKIGFFFINLGLITGAIWAYYSWGTYWSWDPKETWALINILVLSLYFHSAKLPVSSNKKSLIVIITFLTLLFTYWGVNYFLSGMHSYN